MQSVPRDSEWGLGSLRDYGTYVGGYRQLLADRGYNPRTTVPTSYLDRIEKELLCYDKCTLKELRKFAKDRGAHRKPQNVGRATLTSALLGEDLIMKFHRFLDLAPELRNIIYELYFADFGTLLTPSQPPLSRTSHQIRGETLSTFYACCSFKVELIGRIRPHWRFSIHSMSFLNGLRAVDVGRLSSLSLDIGPMGFWGWIKVVKDKTDKYTITLEDTMLEEGTRYPGVQKRLNDYFKDKKLTTGEKKLEIDDIWKIRSILEQQG
ncbi:hypothetical protein HII31_06009 [Pseudocercospora fuligena]|uniref:Uncharacterized protein n=1 Tax=Pseudocercospora fuligena TaxID=685502 RepID=A0A8H6VMZ7_9PEZI|nr:hypothetical protein HII31_06009 [Pseudocercospora fuligena]